VGGTHTVEDGSAHRHTKVKTVYPSNDAVLRKDDPFDSYKSEFSYLTDFFGKIEKITIVSIGKF